MSIRRTGKSGVCAARAVAAVRDTAEFGVNVGQTFLSAGSGDFPVARSLTENDGSTGPESPVNRQAGKPAPQVDFGKVMERMRRLRADISPHDAAKRFSELGVDVFLGAKRSWPGKAMVNPPPVRSLPLE